MGRKGRRSFVAVAGIAAIVAAVLLLARGAAPPPSPPRSGGEGRGEGAGSTGSSPSPPTLTPIATSTATATTTLRFSAGWEESAELVADDLRRILDGRARAGAYEDARADAARLDLARFPPDRALLARLLRGSERERLLALAALAARPGGDDELAGLALRAQRPEDEPLARLLGAELAAALPADAVARLEEELLRAFEREPSPLVLSVALPALERMEAPRLRALLASQLALADPAMLPVLAALARGRLGPEDARALGLPSPPGAAVTSRGAGAPEGAPR